MIAGPGLLEIAIFATRFCWHVKLPIFLAIVSVLAPLANRRFSPREEAIQ
jgi:hypothetical protein